MASSSTRIIVAKMMRTRVVDIASALRVTQPSDLRVLGAGHITDVGRRNALFETLASTPPPSGTGEHLIIVPRAAAEEVFGIAQLGPPTASIASSASPLSLSGGNAPGRGSELVEVQGDVALDSLAWPTSELPSLSLASIAAERNDGVELRSLRRTATVKHEHRRGPPLPEEIQNLFYAAEMSSVEDLRASLAACALGDVNRPHPVHGGTCLHAVAGLLEERASDAECVTILCDGGAEVNARAGNQSTPLHWAAGAGNVGVVNALLRHGADPALLSSTWKSNVFGKGSGQTAAHWAAESGNLECVEAIIANSPLAPFIQDERGQSPTDLATKEGHDELLPVFEAASQVDMICLAVSTEAAMHQVVGSGFKQSVDEIAS